MLQILMKLKKRLVVTLRRGGLLRLLNPYLIPPLLIIFIVVCFKCFGGSDMPTSHNTQYNTNSPNVGLPMNQRQSQYDVSGTGKPSPCRRPENQLDDLVNLAIIIHTTLDFLRVHHTLCYGTLWGALRQGRIRPWDTNVDFCIVDQDLVGVSLEQLQRVLDKAPLPPRRQTLTDSSSSSSSFLQSLTAPLLQSTSVSALLKDSVISSSASLAGSSSSSSSSPSATIWYDWRTGKYNIKYGEAVGVLHVFTKYRNPDMTNGFELPNPLPMTMLADDYLAVPAGRMMALLRYFGQKQPKIPGFILEAPYKTVKFHERNFPVPNDGLELLKYLYADDWHIDVKPPGC